MRAYFQQVVYRISGSYWFIPSLMVISAIIFAQVTIYIDRHVGTDWLQDMWFVALNQPDGARAILATVAGSMITVAGVTFSLTTLAVSHASTQFGPRLLANFMHDRGNQITLGTFVSTFIYCLMVLRVVRGEDVVAEDGLSVGVFVPQLSLLIALFLTLGSIAVLIYFIHHVPDSIHISSLLKRLATDMQDKLDDLYPENIGDSPAAKDPNDNFEFTPSMEVRSQASGYLQGIDDIDLLELAKERNLVVQLHRRPGDFIRPNELIAQVGNCDSWEKKDADRVREAITIGFARTPTQDVFYIINELVEVAVRALSPGVNDPFTAMQCIDWLSAGMIQLAERRLPARHRPDKDGTVRIITTEVNYNLFVDAAFWQLVPYVVQDPNATRYMTTSLQRTIQTSSTEPLNRELQKVIDRLAKATIPSEV